MSFKRVILLAGTALLVAACNSGITAPVSAARGGALSNAKGASQDTVQTATPPAASSSSMDNCTYTVPLGYVDTTCPTGPGQ
jgi:hypothetical protein